MNEKILDRCLLGTQIKHPDWDLARYINGYIEDYFNRVFAGKGEDFSDFLSGISRECYGIRLRDELIDLVNTKGYNPIEGLFKRYYDLSCDILLSNDSKYESLEFMVKMYKSKYEKFVNSGKSLVEYVLSSSEEMYYLLKSFMSLSSIYLGSIDKSEVFGLDSIVNDNVTKTGSSVITNSVGTKLLDSYGGTLLDGMIDAYTDRGYRKNPERVQQDAILSMSKSKDFFINVVADGAGGGENAEKASKEIVDNIRVWFDNLDIEPHNLSDDEAKKILYSLNDTLRRVDTYIYQRYNNCYSTVVIALTIGDKTLIANVGDSMAYQYNSSTDSLEELTHRDSHPSTEGMDYETFRHDPNSNIISSDIGSNIYRRLHCSIVNNVGQKIIISSDGVTDLTSEEKFKSYFKRDVSAKEIVDYAVNTPDVTRYKNADNTSAIVIKLPDLRIVPVDIKYSDASGMSDMERSM